MEVDASASCNSEEQLLPLRAGGGAGGYSCPQFKGRWSGGCAVGFTGKEAGSARGVC